MVRFSRHQRAAFARVARKFDLDLVVLFGSQVKKSITIASDIDVGVVPRKDLDVSRYSLLVHRLGEVFGKYNIDLTILKHVSPLLLGQIARNCQLLCERKEGLFLNFRLSAMRRYADAFPIFKMQEEYLHRKVEKYQRELSRP